jgi:predicted N-acetyltransferase YhbS
MVTIRHERPADTAAREALLDVSYGPVRFTKTSERLREGRRPELSFVATEAGFMIGTVRLWSVTAGRERPALLLGPLAVDPGCRKRGIGSTLVRHALREATRRRHGAVLLVGDESYYGRFGFTAEKTGALWLPGPYEQDRLLACELVPGALDGARGLIGASGRLEQRPDLAALVAGLVRDEEMLTPRAA